VVDDVGAGLVGHPAGGELDDVADGVFDGLVDVLVGVGVGQSGAGVVGAGVGVFVVGAGVGVPVVGVVAGGSLVVGVVIGGGVAVEVDGSGAAGSPAVGFGVGARFVAVGSVRPPGVPGSTGGSDGLSCGRPWSGVVGRTGTVTPTCCA